MNIKKKFVSTGFYLEIPFSLEVYNKWWEMLTDIFGNIKVLGYYLDTSIASREHTEIVSKILSVFPLDKLLIYTESPLEELSIMYSNPIFEIRTITL
jgi:hypothetical protein